MKKVLLMLAAVFAFGVSTASFDAEAAKRMGSGKSMGTQKQTADKAPATPPAAAATAAPAAGAAAAAAGKRSWMGPLAGLAAGLGLAALASHLGFGDELASMLMMGLLAVAVMAAVAFFMRKRAAAQANGGAGGMQPAYAGAGANAPTQIGSTHQSAPVHKFDAPQAASASGSAIGSGIGSGIGAGLAANQPVVANIPADFDTAAFERNAKVNFIRLQAANDAGNLDDIRQFTTPEMFAEISMELKDRGPSTQKNDVVSMDAKVMDVEETAERYIVSVRFTGLMRDGSDAPYERFDEIWHLTKTRQGNGGWMLSGIQQME